MIGTSIDRYRIVEEIGHGGMSVVYRGVDTALERDVAVKVLHNHLARKAESRQRFHREAKAIARLKHPNILDVYDYSSEDAERSYIVMEYVAGNNLREFLAIHGKAPAEAAALVGIGICGALITAHEHGIIHRDLKPENVMVSLNGDLKLMDFGIAHVIDAETMTQTGSLMGSPAHMSPEMIEGERVDARADVFALGTVLYWLSTGSLPFDGQNAPQILKRVLQGQYDRLTTVEPQAGRHFQAIVDKCMAHDPDDRYQTAREALAALTAFVSAAGIESADLELRRYLGHPAVWMREWQAALVPKLIERGQEALARGDTMAAVASLDRALAYEPDNTAVHRCLARIHQRRQTAILAGAAAVICLVGGLAYAFWPSPEVVVAPQEIPEVEVAVSQPAENAADQVLAAAAIASTTSDAQNLARMIVERTTTVAKDTPQRLVAFPPSRPLPILMPLADVGVVAPAEDPTFTYAFRVYPPAAQVMVAGRTYSSFEAAKGISLEKGRHVLTAASRGCKKRREIVEVNGPQAQIRDLVLEWEDGTVRVMADVDSLIFIGDDTRNVARRVSGGQSASFRFPFGSSDSENQQRTTFHIAPASDMTKRQTYSVVVRPGTVETINVAFRNR